MSLIKAFDIKTRADIIIAVSLALLATVIFITAKSNSQNLDVTGKPVVTKKLTTN